MTVIFFHCEVFSRLFSVRLVVALLRRRGWQNNIRLVMQLGLNQSFNMLQSYLSVPFNHQILDK